MAETFVKDGFEYEIVELKENPIHSIIKKRGVSELNFTLREYMGEQIDLVKTLKEKKGQHEIDSAFAEKALSDHPEIADMSDELLAAAARYFVKSQSVKKLELEIPEYEKAIAENEESIKFLCDSFKIDLNSNEKNVIEVVEEAKDIAEVKGEESAEPAEDTEDGN